MPLSKYTPIELPDPPRPAGNYEPWVLAGNLLFLSGQFPFANGQLRYAGAIGRELTLEQGREAARLAALNALAQIHQALGHLARVDRLVRFEGHVATAIGSDVVPKVLDGASDVFLSALGKRGHHTRAAFCATMLPLNASVEIVVTVLVARSNTIRA
jgi:enamine deaminase RidA (YjgF/YER057c/UK114 family)